MIPPLSGIVLNGVSRGEVEALFSWMEKNMLGKSFARQTRLLGNGSLVELMIQKNGPVPIYTATVREIPQSPAEQYAFILEHGWMAWNNADTPPWLLYLSAGWVSPTNGWPSTRQGTELTEYMIGPAVKSERNCYATHFALDWPVGPPEIGVLYPPILGDALEYPSLVATQLDAKQFTGLAQLYIQSRAAAGKSVTLPWSNTPGTWGIIVKPKSIMVFTGLGDELVEDSGLWEWWFVRFTSTMVYRCKMVVPESCACLVKNLTDNNYDNEGHGLKMLSAVFSQSIPSTLVEECDNIIWGDSEGEPGIVSAYDNGYPFPNNWGWVGDKEGTKFITVMNDGGPFQEGGGYSWIARIAVVWHRVQILNGVTYVPTLSAAADEKENWCIGYESNVRLYVPTSGVDYARVYPPYGEPFFGDRAPVCVCFNANGDELIYKFSGNASETNIDQAVSSEWDICCGADSKTATAYDKVTKVRRGFLLPGEGLSDIEQITAGTTIHYSGSIGEGSTKVINGGFGQTSWWRQAGDPANEYFWNLPSNAGSIIGTCNEYPRAGPVYWDGNYTHPPQSDGSWPDMTNTYLGSVGETQHKEVTSGGSAASILLLGYWPGAVTRVKSRTWSWGTGSMTRIWGVDYTGNTNTAIIKQEVVGTTCLCGRHIANYYGSPISTEYLSGSASDFEATIYHKGVLLFTDKTADNWSWVNGEEINGIATAFSSYGGHVFGFSPTNVVNPGIDPIVLTKTNLIPVGAI